MHLAANLRGLREWDHSRNPRHSRLTSSPSSKQLPTFFRNGPIFPGANDQDADLRIHSRDVRR